MMIRSNNFIKLHFARPAYVCKCQDFKLNGVNAASTPEFRTVPRSRLRASTMPNSFLSNYVHTGATHNSLPWTPPSESKTAGARSLRTHLHLVPRSRMREPLPPLLYLRKGDFTCRSPWQPLKSWHACSATNSSDFYDRTESRSSTDFRSLYFHFLRASYYSSHETEAETETAHA